MKAELKRVLKPGANVYLVGNTSILSSSVTTQVKALGFTPKRLTGADRFATSVAVAKTISTSPKYVFLASGTDAYASLPAAAAAGAQGTSSAGGLVLSNGKKLSSSVKSYLNGINPNKTMVITVGADAKYALTHTSFSRWPSSSSYYPITGSTKEALSVNLAKFWWSAPSNVALAYSGSWRDGLSAASAMNIFGPVLWTSRPTLSSAVTSYLLRESGSTNSVIAFGGTGSVTAGALSSAGASAAANGSYVTYTQYYNGDDPASTRTSSQSLRSGDGTAAIPARSGPVGVDPHLETLRTVLHR